ncbi:MAG: hypothetical protein JAY90_14545 [Candidatus Thiodiazotropha lotti]|nr:hypothetical protein [Candidatus Thiodiazotropha lotti]
MPQKLKSLLKLIWWLLVLTFVSLFLYKNLNTTLEIVSKLPVMIISAAFIALLVAKTLLVQMMHLALNRYQINFGYLRCFIIYNITQLGKYIPGSIWQFVGRIGFYREAGVANNKIRDTLLLETFWVVSSALIIGICLIMLEQHQLLFQLVSRIPESIIQPAVLLPFAGLILIITLVYKNSLFSYLKQFMFTPKTILVASLIWISLGYSFWVTLLPYTDQELSFIYIVGLYALSYALGFAVPFAPAGIGIREAVLVTGLLSYLDSNISIVLATINRLLYIVSEIILAVISNFISSKQSHLKNTEAE